MEPNKVPLPVPEELEPNFEDAQEQEEVVNMAPKNMPSPYARDAPRFNSDKPKELNRYIWRLEELFTKHGVNEDKDKIRYLGTYADVRTEKEWEAMNLFSMGTFVEPPVYATLIYHILITAQQSDWSTVETAHHPNFSHMLYGCWGCQG